MSYQVKESEKTSTKRKRQHETNASTPTDARKSRKQSAESSPASEIMSQEDISSKPASKHTKKERKQNRSTRIHSLRKQLARGTLPSTIQQEKERELAALVHEQAKTVNKKQVKKTLEKYHYVRFLERRKAEKKLKQLWKQQKAQGDSPELSERIHEMEVNLNYAIYAPLGEKYVSMFVPGSEGQSNDIEVNPGERPPKPASWYAVETAMLGGEVQLEALREGRTITHTVTELDSKEAGQKHKKSSSKPSKDHLSQEAPRRQSRTNRKVTFQVDEGEEPSSDNDEIDGGFFER